jgi:hypothetical protein
MAAKPNSQLTVSGAIVFRDYGGKRKFLIVKINEDSQWEIPKITVRRGESSVRATLRLTGEMAGMSTTVLEEAGRSSGTSVVNGQSMPVKYYYYLLVQRSGGELLGFARHEWFEFSEALKKLALKKEKEMLKSAKSVLREWEKARKIR